MKRTGNALLIKEINRNIILNHIRDNNPVSRAEIATECGLNRSTVSSLVDGLIEEGMVFETGTGESRGGRKPILLEFNPLAATIIGMELGVNYVVFLLSYLNARIIKKKVLKISPSMGFEAIVDSMGNVLDNLIKETPSTPGGFAGIGIGVAGLVDYRSGNITFAPNLEWRNAPLGTLFSERYNCTVFMDNEANAGAMGEMMFGKSHKEEDIIYLSINEGLGAGIIMDRKVFRGCGGYAGEVGHTTLVGDGPRCSCGNNGCWEMFTSETALKGFAAGVGLEINKIIAEGSGNNCFTDTLSLMAHRGDISARRVFEKAGEYLGLGLANLINTLNPSNIVIGGKLSGGFKWMQGTMQEVVEKRVLSELLSGIKIVPSSLGKEACATGGIGMVLQGILHEPL